MTADDETAGAAAEEDETGDGVDAGGGTQGTGDAERSDDDGPAEPTGGEAPTEDSDDGRGDADGADLADRVAEDDEELASDVRAALAEERERAEELEGELDDLRAELDERNAEVEALTDRLKRSQADFQNYKRRAERRREELQERATEGLVTRLLDVRDNLDRALEGDAVEGVREGVEATRREFDRVLDAENVTPIDPDPGADVDPERHEVLMRVEADQPNGTVAEVYRPGYEMGGKVLRAAQVTVSDESGEEE